MMGNHQEATNSQEASGGTNATISGSTASIGVLSLILAIISVAVPNWGYYFLGAQSYNDYSGHFGPFQTCRYYFGGVSDCHGQTAFKSSTWIFAAGIVAIVTVIAIGVFVLFSILHVAMQLQKRSIWLKDIKTAMFLKLVSSSVAVIGCVVAIALSSWEFEIARRKNTVFMKFGICYYFQIVLIALNLLLVGLSFMSYRKGGETPFPTPSSNPGYPYEVGHGGGGGISITNASGSPYPHGQPRMPPFHHPQPSGYGHPASATLSVPQPIRTIQPTPKAASSSLPGYYTGGHPSASPQVGLNDHRGPGVSFTPGGSTKFVKMGGHDGSMESLNSTQSLTLSMGSTASTGSSHGPLKSMLKKPHIGELGSVTSEGSAKHVKLSIGGEQTAV